MPAIQSKQEAITLEQYEALPEDRRPDIMVICDKDKLDGKRCNGAPDFIIEIVSPTTLSHDYIRNLYYYEQYGVREYWIVDPRQKTVNVYFFEKNIVGVSYPFHAAIKVNLYEDLFIDFSEIAENLYEW